MKEEDEVLIEKLQQLNSEYLISGEYALGVYVKYLYSLLKEKKFVQFFRMLVLHLKNKKNKNKLEPNDINRQIDIINKKYIINNKTEKSIAIYTCITGDYDKIEEPLILEKACDYFLFTNNNKLKSESWNIREIPKDIIKVEDNAKINRYIKMHPKELFPNYDYAIYIDGNIKLISTISQLINKINSKTGLAIHRHCQRNCIYEEIKACRAYGKGKYNNMKAQAKRYRKEGFPRNYGMLECNMLISDLNNKNSYTIFHEWWKEYLQSESMRDQIALPYVLWKNNLKVDDVGSLGNNINKNYLIKINAHK